APSRGAQTPLDPTTYIPAEQIEQDLKQLVKISECVRTYSIENGVDQVPAIAGKLGLKVMQGIWLGSNRAKNFAQISTAIRLTKENPDVITSLVVGNEVLLRGEMTTTDLAAIIRSVKTQVTVPVTYADVWNTGCATAKSMTRSTSIPTITCHTGKTSRSAPNLRPPMSI